MFTFWDTHKVQFVNVLRVIIAHLYHSILFIFIFLVLKIEPQVSNVLGSIVLPRILSS